MTAALLHDGWGYYWRCAADSHGNVGLSDWMERNEQNTRSDGASTAGSVRAGKAGAVQRVCDTAGPGRSTSQGAKQ